MSQVMFWTEERAKPSMYGLQSLLFPTSFFYWFILSLESKDKPIIYAMYQNNKSGSSEWRRTKPKKPRQEAFLLYISMITFSKLESSTALGFWSYLSSSFAYTATFRER